MEEMNQELELYEKMDEYDSASYAILKPEDDSLIWAVHLNQSKLIDVFGKVPDKIMVRVLEITE